MLSTHKKNTTNPTNPTKLTNPTGLSSALTFLLASGAGLSAATLYYTQPMLGVINHELQTSSQQLGLIPTLTQLGYALGILFLAPLSDRHNRRSIILLKAALLTLALLAAAFAGNIGMLLMTSLAIGITATMAQDIVPAAATLAHEHSRGKVVGTVMTGLLMGILLSRVVSGLIAEAFGWRAVFMFAAATVGAIGMAAARGLPNFTPTTQLSYGALLKSLGLLFQKHAPLRQAALAQGLLSAGFSAFWSTLALMLHASPFHLGSAAAGAFGIAGAAGALAAPIAGRLADKHSPGMVSKLGTGITTLSFGGMLLSTTLPPLPQLWVLALCTVMFDLGVQATLVSHQTIVYGIDPAARSRLNAVLFVGMFIGMAAGSAIASVIFAHWGWVGVLSFATTTSTLALGVRFISRRK